MRPELGSESGRENKVENGMKLWIDDRNRDREIILETIDKRMDVTMRPRVCARWTRRSGMLVRKVS